MNKEQRFITIAALLSGTITLGGQFFANLGFSLYEISLYPTIFTICMLLPFILKNKQYGIKKEMFIFFVIYGLIAALSQLTEFGAIILGVPVAIVALLLYSQPIVTVIFGKLMFDEKITLRKVSAIAVAIVGIIILLKPWGITSVGSPAGILTALLGGVFVSLWVIWGRKSGIKNQHYITTIFGVAGFSVVWLLVLWPIIRLFTPEKNIVHLSTSFPLHYGIYLLIFALISGVIPHSLFYKAIPNLEASNAGIMLMLEPVSATILATLLFKQTITWNIIVGGALILISSYIVTKNKCVY